MDQQEITRELQAIRSQMATLEKRLDEAERRPQEILEEIERIWTEDPKAAEGREKE